MCGYGHRVDDAENQAHVDAGVPQPLPRQPTIGQAIPHPAYEALHHRPKTLVVIWKYLEPSFRVYKDEALDDLIRVCEYAAKYELQVMIDFHTMMHEGSFTVPEWLSPRKFETVFTNDTARQAWLDFLGHCVSHLSGVENIHSWHMMNEPARHEWACDVTVDEFIELWREMRDVFKTHSGKPVSIRFGGRHL